MTQVEGSTVDSTDGFELQVLRQLSHARSKPGAVAESIRQRLAHYRGMEYFPLDRGGKTAVVTKEGQAAVRDAIAYLQKRTPLDALADASPQGLCLAADDHLHDLGSRGAVGHEGADGSRAADRMKRYGAWSGKCGECLWFGRADATAQQIVEDLIIDDGVPSRGHRLGIYDPAYSVAGVRMGSHKTFGACCVIEFASRYEDNEAKLVDRVMRGPPEVDMSKVSDNTQWKNLGTCRGCGDAILGGGVIEALGHKWHKDCFTCQAAGCGKSLRGVPYHDIDGLPFCKDCSAQLKGSTCNGCKNKITGRVLHTMGHTWHKECFVCGGCKGELEAKFANRDGMPLCRKCSLLPAASPAGLGRQKRTSSQPTGNRTSPQAVTSRPKTPPPSGRPRPPGTPPPRDRPGAIPKIAPARNCSAPAPTGRLRSAPKLTTTGAVARTTAPRTVPFGTAKKTVDVLGMGYADLE